MSDASSESEPEEEPEDDESEEEEAKEEEGEVELSPEGEWAGTPNEAFDLLMTNRMNATYEQEDVVQMHPSARNTGTAYANMRAQPLAPRNGF